jgi:hypothetical protein
MEAQLAVAALNSLGDGEALLAATALRELPSPPLMMVRSRAYAEPQ